jgi:hypothetical protein
VLYARIAALQDHSHCSSPAATGASDLRA